MSENLVDNLYKARRIRIESETAPLWTRSETRSRQVCRLAGGCTRSRAKKPSVG